MQEEFSRRAYVRERGGYEYSRTLFFFGTVDKLENNNYVRKPQTEKPDYFPSFQIESCGY